MEFLHGFRRVGSQTMAMVQTHCSCQEGEAGHEENAVDVRHVVHDRLLQVVDVTCALVPHPKNYIFSWTPADPDSSISLITNYKTANYRLT